MDKVNSIYNKLSKKLRKALSIFTIINMIIFLLSAGIIILNIYAIRKNPADDNFTKWIFVAMTIMVTISGVVGSITSLYVFRKRNKDVTDKLQKIEEEKEKYLSKTDDYKDIKLMDEKLIENVTKILNS